MRTHGTLIRWDDDRGFGFVAIPHGREEIFVHISAFPRGSGRPRVGETIYFELRTGADGRKRAELVERSSGPKVPGARRPYSRKGEQRSLGTLLKGAAVLAVGVAGYNAYVPRESESIPAMTSRVVESAHDDFRCDGRTHCSQMMSCEEARYFLASCPGVQMDGDADGQPCEQQWCN